MPFRLDKCELATFNKGRLSQLENTVPKDKQVIKSLKPAEYSKLDIKKGQV